MSTAVIVPWGTDDGPRAAVWATLLPRWIQAGVNLIVTGDPLRAERGKFSVARAINNAVRTAPPEMDRFVCIGADAEPDRLTVEWADVELDAEPWTLLYDRGRGQSEDGRWGPIEVFPTPCVGPIGFTRTTWERVGGLDERYEGWGYEDVDFWLRLQRITPRSGPQTYLGQSLDQYWHPVDHHDLTMNNPNVRLYVETWG